MEKKKKDETQIYILDIGVICLTSVQWQERKGVEKINHTRRCEHSTFTEQNNTPLLVWLISCIPINLVFTNFPIL